MEYGVNASGLPAFDPVERHMVPLSYPKTLLEFYFVTIPLEITWTQVKKMLMRAGEEELIQQRKFLLKCGQRQSLIIIWLTDKRRQSGRSMLLGLWMTRPFRCLLPIDTGIWTDICHITRKMKKRQQPSWRNQRTRQIECLYLKIFLTFSNLSLRFLRCFDEAF